MIFIILGVLFVVEFIMYITPNDITTLILGSDWTEERAAVLRHEIGIDQPLLVQYGRYVWGLLRGDFGTSPLSGIAIKEQLAARFPNTLRLMIGAVSITVIVAIPIGKTEFCWLFAVYDLCTFWCIHAGVLAGNAVDPSFQCQAEYSPFRWFRFLEKLRATMCDPWFDGYGEYYENDPIQYAGIDTDGLYSDSQGKRCKET